MPKKLFLKDFYSLFGQLAEKSEVLRKEKIEESLNYEIVSARDPFNTFLSDTLFIIYLNCLFRNGDKIQ